MNNTKNLEGIRHSLAHLLAAAVLKKFPDAKLAIGPVIENGFYYDFLLSRGLTPEDLKDFEKDMKKMIGGKLPFSGKEVTRDEAREIFKDQPFKLELIEEFSSEEKTLTTYKTGEVFLDLCRGGHVDNTSEINPDAFKLEKTAGAYWRGDANKPMLQRIYGLAFETKEELDSYLKMMEEAKKRDHKKLGPELDLFTFSELVGSGLPLWTPKGALLRDLLDNFVWELRKKRGYNKVEIPHITKQSLYETSGHWEKYKDDLFKIITREGHVFAMKPMNCPHHTQIYARKPHSYRELPQRFANTTMVYRDEQSGELAGLSRVLSITQDDAHVFCRLSQSKDEVVKIWDIINEFYGTFGIQLRVRLSTRDPLHPEKYLGDSARWDAAEKILTEVVDLKESTFENGVGEAAFYGPKLDFMGKDAIGREHQVATIQLDMNMPERFDLTCTNEKGEAERIVMIHAAIMGSTERFLALAIEHFAGAFPLWLAPVQAIILPVSAKFEEYANKVSARLTENGMRVEISDPNETLGKRIRESEMRKIPYVLVVGEKEEADETVSIRHYKRGQEGTEKLDALLEKLSREVKERTLQ